MKDKQTDKNTRQLTIRMPKELYEQIEKLAIENERDVAKQIRYMLDKYIKVIK